MKVNKFVLFLLITLLLLIIPFVLFFSNDTKKIDKKDTPKNTDAVIEKKVDYIKEFSKIDNSKDKCSNYVNRVSSEIESYKARVNRSDSNNSESFDLIGIFYSNNLKKCFYVLKNSYTADNNKVIDYIINNAEKEETLDIFNNIDYTFLNERIEELQK